MSILKHLRFVTILIACMIGTVLPDFARAQWRADEARSISIHMSKNIQDERLYSLCNSVAFAPIEADLFVGRVLNSPDGGCSGTRWSLGIFKMDWAARTLSLIDIILKAPLVTPNGIKINKAYDPYITKYKGKFWIAFECTGMIGVNSCVAPFSLKNGIDLSRLTMPIVGKPISPGVTTSASGSVPKLLSFKGHLYLYWSSVSTNKYGKLINIETRGAELDLDSGEAWVAGSEGTSKAADDPSFRRVMKTRRGNDEENVIAELMDVTEYNGSVMALVARGGTKGDEPCHNSESRSISCYTLTIVRSARAIGEGIFDKQPLAIGDLPHNPQSYARFLRKGPPDTSLSILSMLHHDFGRAGADGASLRGLFYYKIKSVDLK